MCEGVKVFSFSHGLKRRRVVDAAQLHGCVWVGITAGTLTMQHATINHHQPPLVMCLDHHTPAEAAC